jgi:TM2 domain-containing membrane protein YozV
MTDWYYSKPGWMKDETLGPIDNETLIRMVRSGEITLDMNITSPTVTSNQWKIVKQFPKLVEAHNEGEKERAAERAREKELRQKEKLLNKEEKLIQKEQRLQKQRKLTKRKDEESDRQLTSPYHEPFLPQTPPTPIQPSTLAAQPVPPVPIQNTQGYVVENGLPFRAGQTSQLPTMQQVVIIQQATTYQPPRQSNAVPVLLNAFLLPGLGQLVQGRMLAGFVFLGLWFISWAALLVFIGVLMLPVVWLISIVDAASYHQ